MDRYACKSAIDCSRRFRILVSIAWVQILVVVGLSACQHAASAHSPEDENYLAATLTSTSPVLPDMSTGVASNPFSTLPSLTSVPSSIATTISGGEQENVFPQATGIAPTLDPNLLRFDFPTPGPQPVSAWRPPLYPVPWALSPNDHFYFARPIAADEVNWPLWDYRYGGAAFPGVVHTGIDIPVLSGTPVIAAGSGKIIWAGYGLYRGIPDPKDPYGIAVAIRHDFGFHGSTLYTVYGHLSDVDVVEGEYVQLGQKIGMSGATGKVTGPHLHFEVRLNKNDYFTTGNPELWLVPPQGWGVLVGRVMDSGGNLKTNQDVIVKSNDTGLYWRAKSYGPEAINSDSYYNENLVISDLPAGSHQINIPYNGYKFVMDVNILPGRVTYFTFTGRFGIKIGLPPAPGADFTPAP